MALDRSSPLAPPQWGRRVVEWGILVILVLVLMGVFVRQVRVVQGQAELAAVKSTLGALRTTLVISYLEQSVGPRPTRVAALQRNPFLLLKNPPANYAGEFGALQTEQVPPGNWVFDPDCSCIGYLPLYPQWLESPPQAQAAWFRVGGTQGPLQITAMDAYIWQGQVLN